jgi:hypothetical protein
MKVASKIPTSTTPRNVREPLFNCATRAEQIGMRLESCAELLSRFVATVPAGAGDEPLSLGLESLLERVVSDNQSLITHLYSLHKRAAQ